MITVGFLVASHAALLIGLPSIGFVAPRNDCRAVQDGLLGRGWKREEIVVSAPDIMTPEAFVSQLTSLAESPSSDCILYVSGEGHANFTTLESSPQRGLPAWSRILAILGAHSDKRFFVWTDSSYSNLVAESPPNVSFVGLQGSWRDVTKTRSNSDETLLGSVTNFGTMSYILGRELPYVSSNEDLANRVTNYKNSGSMGAMWFDGPVLQVIGPHLWMVPGVPRTL